VAFGPRCLKQTTGRASRALAYWGGYTHRPLVRLALLLLATMLCAAAEGEIGRAQRERILYDHHETLEPNLIDDALRNQTIGLNSNGSAVVRAQILLNRAHFSCGQIDGEFGANLRKTVAAFQRNRNLPAEGTVGRATWDVLNADTAPALTTYTVAQEDVVGPFGIVPLDMMKQAKLKYLGYESPLDGLAEKFHLSPKLLQGLNPDKNFGQLGEQILVPNVIIGVTRRDLIGRGFEVG